MFGVICVFSIITCQRVSQDFRLRFQLDSSVLWSRRRNKPSRRRRKGFESRPRREISGRLFSSRERESKRSRLALQPLLVRFLAIFPLPSSFDLNLFPTPSINLLAIDLCAYHRICISLPSYCALIRLLRIKRWIFRRKCVPTLYIIL